ncbi:hypothetical protein BGZ54_001359 [Gamsiella multidivaricata]|nr:hypothetical protein BGZ54_001359 [Gamsiella multidivaricata]
MESDSVESSTAEPLRNPFSSQDLGNWDNGGGDNDLDSLDDNPFSPTKASIIAEAESVQEEDVREEEEPLTKNTDTISELEPINGLGLMTFSSQLSGESLRRLALSPRKQKRKKELSPGMMPSMPTLTFSEKLAAEMGEIGGGEGSLFGLIRKAKPLTLGKVAVVDGSDSGSEADWNDDEVVATLTSKKSKQGVLFDGKTSNKAPMMLEESDSDLEDNPFSSHNSIASSPTPLTISTSDKSEEDINVDLELSEDDKLDEDQALAKQRVTRSCTHAVTPPRSGRTLRSATLKPAPTLASLPKGAIKPARAKAVLFSLDSLLKEKKRKEKIGYDIEAANSMMTLDDELLEEYDEDDDEEALFGTEMIPKGVLSEEQEGVLTDIIEDEQNQTVEDIAEFFVHWPLELVVQPLEQELCDKDLDDHIVQKVLKATQTEMQRNQFLTSPFLMIMSSSPWTMPRSLFRWLVHVVAVEQNTAVTLSLFALLQRVLSQKSGVLGVDHQDLIRAFRMYGAKDEYLDPDWKVTPVTRETQNERLIRKTAALHAFSSAYRSTLLDEILKINTGSLFRLYVLVPETAKFPRQSLKAVVKLVTMTATLDPQFYNVAEIRKIVNLLMRMTTDPIIGDVKSLLGSTIVALLDAIPADDWEVEVPMLINVLH